MAPSAFFRLALAAVLVALIIASALARAPRRPVPRAELRWVLLGAVALYAVGLVALIKHLSQVSIVLSATGIAVSALAAWLSRGTDPGSGPPGGDEPVDEQPPPDPDGLPAFDWAAFERELQAYMERAREPVSGR